MLISYIMPTYNSAKTIKKSLQSIRMQTIDQDQVEIIVVDGGSTDNTIAIARSYGAIILDNPERLPEPAKKLGMLYAKGKYICEMDSDEELLRNNQIMKRIRMMEENSVYIAVTDRLICPTYKGISAEYINCYGDPFTKFVYKMKIGNRLTFKKYLSQGSIYENYRYSKYPIGDGSTTIINWEYVKESFKDKICDQEFINSVTSRVLEKERRWICIKGDNIFHHNQLTLHNQFRKIKFRVINNVHSPKESGFSARNNKNLNRRKYLFVIYACTLIWPIVESFSLVIKHHNYKYFIHALLVYYTMYEIFIQYIYKLMGVSQYNANYAK